MKAESGYEDTRQATRRRLCRIHVVEQGTLLYRVTRQELDTRIKRNTHTYFTSSTYIIVMRDLQDDMTHA